MIKYPSFFSNTWVTWTNKNLVLRLSTHGQIRTPGNHKTSSAETISEVLCKQPLRPTIRNASTQQAWSIASHNKCAHWIAVNAQLRSSNLASHFGSFIWVLPKTSSDSVKRFPKGRDQLLSWVEHTIIQTPSSSSMTHTKHLSSHRCLWLKCCAKSNPALCLHGPKRKLGVRAVSTNVWE